jgi:hypothetical protein
MKHEKFCQSCHSPPDNDQDPGTNANATLAQNTAGIVIRVDCSPSLRHAERNATACYEKDETAA